MNIVLAAAVITIAAALLVRRLEKILTLKLDALTVAVTNLEAAAVPVDNSDDQATVDQLTERVNAVAQRFSPALPPLAADGGESVEPVAPVQEAQTE